VSAAENVRAAHGLPALVIVGEVLDERRRQDEKWGEQNHPDGTGGVQARALSDALRELCDREHEAGAPTWAAILAEEVGEAFAESDEDALRVELLQVAAVAQQWVEALDRRRARRAA